MKNIEKLLAERKPTLIELLWDRLFHCPDKWNGIFNVLEHRAEFYACKNAERQTYRKARMWDRMDLIFWRLRHPKSRIFKIN